MKHTLFSRTVQIACVKTHEILRTRPMRFYACVIFDAIIRNEITQRILSESTLMILLLLITNPLGCLLLIVQSEQIIARDLKANMFEEMNFKKDGEIVDWWLHDSIQFSWFANIKLLLSPYLWDWLPPFGLKKQPFVYSTRIWFFSSSRCNRFSFIVVAHW